VLAHASSILIAINDISYGTFWR